MVNLFWLSPPRYVRGRGLNYSWCARQHIDAHIIKIPLEAAQLLYAAHHALPAADDWRTRAPMAGTGERGYRPTHMNNPLSKWLRESAAHYRHAVAYGLALCEEYSHRYGREHACEAHLHWLKGHEPAIPYVDDHPDDHGEDNEVARFRIARAPPCAMPDEFKVAPAEESAANAAEAKEEPDEADALSSVAEGDGETATRPLKGSKDKEKVATIKTEKDEEADGDRDDDDDDARRIIAEAELAKRQRREKEEAEEEEEEEEEVEVKTMKVEVELQTTGGDVALIKTETSEETTTTTTTTTTAVSSEAVDDEEERVEDLLRPIEDEVAASEVAFPLHVYQSYRAYYLGQKLSLKMSTFKTRDIPHWAQERVLELRAQPKPAPVKKEKKTTTTTRTRRTTTTTTTTTVAKRKRGQAAKATEAGEEENEDEAAGDEDYTEGRRTRSRTSAQVEQEQDEGEKKKKKTKRTKKNHDDGGDEGQDKGEQEKKRKTSDQLDGGEAVPRRSPRTSKARSTTSTSSADTALSKRRKVAKEIK